MMMHPPKVDGKSMIEDFSAKFTVCPVQKITAYRYKVFNIFYLM